MRVRYALLLSLGAVLLLPATAVASFHLNKIREVYPGDAADPDSEFIELQMFAPGQNLVGGHAVTAYGPGGDEVYTFDGNVASGQNQRTILLASPEAEAEFGVSADLAIDKHALEVSGGAVCFDSIDCVSWGNFADPLPSPVGMNAGPIPDGMSLERSISPGCETLLEAGDDTNDSATDFFAATPSPRSNATAPTEKSCPKVTAPETTITKGPKKKTTKGKAKFKFKSDTAGAKFQCKLDKGRFKRCGSPKTYRHIKRGKHKFKVRAIADGKTDPTPATYKWKRKKPKRSKKG